MTDQSRIRNFCIIAHIDHGKSTLADRLIEHTGAVLRREMKDRMLDTLELEQERGITIKLQTARLNYPYKGGDRSTKVEDGEYILNLIDTPGHVDFSYEVSRSVAASEGCLLLIDVTQGVQAQTLTTVYKAMEYNLKIIPVLNKVDMDIAETERVRAEVIETFGFAEEDIILASGKTGIGVPEILNSIVERIPPPDKYNSQVYTPEQSDLDAMDGADLTPRLLPTQEGGQATLSLKGEGASPVTKALIFDAFFHEYKGATALVKVISGQINKNSKLYMLGTKTNVNPIEIGYLTPKMVKSDSMKEGEVGYIATGLKDIHVVHSGDTITLVQDDNSHITIEPLTGYKSPKPMVYASLYPVEASDYPEFAEALEKLSLNDAALSYEKEYSTALGTGFVCGFLGLLHLEITQDRLEREYGIDLIGTTPTVEFRVQLTTKDYAKLPNINVSNIDPVTNIATIRTAAEFPDGSFSDDTYEPWVKLELITPEEYIGPVMELCQKHRGVYKSMNYLSRLSNSSKHAAILYEMPTVEIIVNFFDKLKSISHGYASMDYSFLDYRKGDIVKVSILVNDEPVEALSYLTHKDNAQRRGKEVVEKLVKIIPRQNFKVPIQAAIGGQVIARETIAAYKKDVLAKLYGGDVTRKLKLLEKQKKGKKKMKTFGKVEIPKEAFLEALKVE
ncbi:MAG: GTP-binding protein [Candidatus Dojkabacteria bacterium]